MLPPTASRARCCLHRHLYYAFGAPPQNMDKRTAASLGFHALLSMLYFLNIFSLCALFYITSPHQKRLLSCCCDTARHPASLSDTERRYVYASGCWRVDCEKWITVSRWCHSGSTSLSRGKEGGKKELLLSFSSATHPTTPQTHAHALSRFNAAFGSVNPGRDLRRGLQSAHATLLLPILSRPNCNFWGDALIMFCFQFVKTFWWFLSLPGFF